MPNESPKTVFGCLYQLVADANLSIVFIEGEGLGAILLTVIAVALIASPSFKKASLVSLIKAWRSKQ
ncbi:hypothetical protein [Pacificibacter sp. AS14]|uniref:hypothetical protein n=1 Tax=Pacificibacter sp. AS14 TaxID=3135785 RepID=UPI003173D480